MESRVTVMTTVYGVTFVGAREQIDRQLRDRGDIPAEECYMVAAYLAKQVRGCRSLSDRTNGFDMLAPSLGTAMHR